MDQYLNPRNLAAATALFATTRVLQGKVFRATLWLVTGLAVHPLMGCFAVAFCLLLGFEPRFESRLPFLALVFPFRDLFVPPTPAYHEAMRFHISHFITNWEWYEWLGLLAPIAIFWSIQRFATEDHPPGLRRVTRVVVFYGLAFFVTALIVTVPKRFEAFSRVQPLRSLHLEYMMLVLVGGGLIAEHILRNRVWRWLALFMPLCAGMYWAQRSLFPASQQVEWPWAAPRNSWTQAFLWIRGNTPLDSLFGIDPFYMQIPGEDAVGFRACAQRSRLADAAKDSGVVSMFPPRAQEWWLEFQAQRGWRQFGKPDFLRLEQQYGMRWVVLQSPTITDLDCPYRNSAIAVCHLAP